MPRVRKHKGPCGLLLVHMARWAPPERLSGAGALMSAGLRGPMRPLGAPRARDAGSEGPRCGPGAGPRRGGASSGAGTRAGSAGAPPGPTFLAPWVPSGFLSRCRTPAFPLETPGPASARPPGTPQHARATRHQVGAQGEEEQKGDAEEDAEDAATPDLGSLLASDRLNLDVYPGGCGLLLRLLREGSPRLQQVRFLRLNCNEEQIGAALAALPSLRRLRSLVLKGGHLRDDWGSCLRGSLTTLPSCLSDLARLAHLDLSFNSLRALPACIPHMSGLDALLLSHNLLESLPEALGALRALTFLSVSSNCLRALPAGMAGLSALRQLDLSENQLDAVPEEIGALSSLTQLNLASNRLRSLPDSLASLQSLQLLLLHSNLLVSVPPSLARLPLLTRLDLRDNRLRAVPREIQEAPFVRLQGNPLGVPEPVPAASPGEDPAPEVPRVLLASDVDSFRVTSRGCSVALACGVRLLFPPGATAAPTTVSYRQLPPEPRLVRLGPHDALLSAVLELRPHGTPFRQEVHLWLPFVSPRARRGRQVVVRTLSGHTWKDLDTRLEREEKPKRLWASCQVPHFSWFLVVSRPVEDSCLVPQQGALLCSSANPEVKVIFPSGVTAEPRHVRMQVVRVPGWALGTDGPAAASPLLCLSQDGPQRFLRPVTIQLPLPPGITGLSLDRSHLHLLHGDPRAPAWDDITAQVALELTHLYARFQVTHFSWYWLWYTTKSCVEGLARKVYERLRLYRVNFIALQRRRDPEQVLLQCLPGKKVEPTLRRLHPRYRGPEPSDTVELFEGEQFFAAFERGIDVDAGTDPEAGGLGGGGLSCSDREDVEQVEATLLPEARPPPARGPESRLCSQTSPAAGASALRRVFPFFCLGRSQPQPLFLANAQEQRGFWAVRRLRQSFWGPSLRTPPGTPMKGRSWTSTVDRKVQAVKGQVSFYRGAVPEAVPEEAVRRRKGPDALWLATLPIKLPRLPPGEGQAPLEGLTLASLNLGDAESGFLTQSNLVTVASRLGPDWQSVALHLGLSYPEVQRIQYAYRDDLDGQVRHMLFSWAERQAGRPGSVRQLLEALEQSERHDVVEEVRAILELGRTKYRESIHRVGLASEEDPLSATA
ncbi:p53-induced death domain-containing protein 1 [Sarcophilus harrisii]|uniref:p53-induced death domain-containing protein 1 n=1 Tax=Sarcophilus harrisii TaxID=9305 RepID=UPI001301B69B|nr:p53-induced death domain-containing protein 1 [Sarcophilus harrisii]